MSTLRDTLLNERRESKGKKLPEVEPMEPIELKKSPCCNVMIGKKEWAKGKCPSCGRSLKESLDTPNLDMIFEAGMSVAEIAKKEGVSRQIVHRQLKSAAGKMYNAMKQATNGSPFKVLLSLAVALNINSQEDFNELKRMLPADIIKDVEADAKNYIRK